MKLLVTILLVTACNVPSVVSQLPGARAWDYCPRVATEASGLRRATEQARKAWNLRSAPNCDSADICVTWGNGRGPAGFARYLQSPCEAVINVNAEGVVTHEVGHCIGLSHSTHPWSVMRTPLPSLERIEDTGNSPFMIVTDSDRRVARRLTTCD